MKVKEIISIIEAIAPKELAAEWDNPGLMLGSAEQETDRVLVCLDLTQNAADYAIANQCGLIVSHHPLFFNPIRSLTEESHIGRLAIKLIKHGISLYSAHTNLDDAAGGVCDRLAETVGLRDLTLCGYGKMGRLDKELSAEDLAASLCDAMNIKALRYHDGGRKRIERVAVCPGSSSDMYLSAIAAGADALVTGEIKYSCALEAAQSGLAVFELGHYQSEKIILPYLARYIEEGAQGLQKDVKVIQLYDDEAVLQQYLIGG